MWAGIDAGKTHHHCVVIDDTGKRLMSRRVANDEPELLRLLADVLALDDRVTWGIDLADGGAALLIDLLLSHGQHTLYIPGMAVNRAAEGYRGEGKTDARDAAIIADQARVRRDLQPLRPGDELVTELKSSPFTAATSPRTARARSTGCVAASPKSSRPWNELWT
jgi:hypothetical protein